MNNKTKRNFKFTMEELYSITDELIIKVQDSNTTTTEKDYYVGEIINVTEELIKNNCHRYIIKKKVTELTSEDLYEIAISFALVESIKKYEVESGVHFLYFWWIVMNRMFNKAFANKTTKKEKMNSGCCDLNETDATEDFSESLCHKSSLYNYILAFEKIDKYGKLIRCEMLSNQEERKVARLYVLGVPQYGNRERKIVQRTKERFKEFLIKNGFER